MSEKIVASTLDEVVEKNKLIHNDLLQKVYNVRANYNNLQVNSASQLALQILRPYGLIQVPIDNQYWSGAIFVKGELRIPVINTAIPRANQYFTAWHEVYHLLFDDVSFDHIVDTDTTLEERKADHFASLMLLGNVVPYYSLLPDMDFLSKVFHCMSVFQAPYKAVLIALYEEALHNGNEKIRENVLNTFDLQFDDLASRFRNLGLDETLVEPSYVVNVNTLQSKINQSLEAQPYLNYHKDNAAYLKQMLYDLSASIGGQDA